MHSKGCVIHDPLIIIFWVAVSPTLGVTCFIYLFFSNSIWIPWAWQAQRLNFIVFTFAYRIIVVFSQATVFCIILASSFHPFNFIWSYFLSHLSKFPLVSSQITLLFSPIISSLCFWVYLYSNYNSIPGQVMQKGTSFHFHIYHCFEVWLSGGRNLIVFVFITWCLAYTRHSVKVSWLDKWINGLLIYRNTSRNVYLNELTFCKKYTLEWLPPN